MKNQKTSIDFKSFLYFYITFAVAIGIATILAKVLPDFTLMYIISETGESVSFSFNLSEILEVILLGPVFCVCSWHANKILIENLSDDARNALKIDNWRSLYLAFITLIMIGGSFHALANKLHSMLKLENVSSGEIFYAVYFWDEILSHYLIPAGYFGMVYINAILDSHENNKDIPLTISERGIVIVLSAILSIIWTYALLEGQTAWFYSLVFAGTIVLLIIFRLMHLIQKRNKPSDKWHVKIRNNPYILFLLVFSIVNVIFVVSWALVTGTKPYMPFLYQPSEIF
ncbi:MAG: hypothetical protein ACTSVI_03940 [Promethearchaeota archaeon]